MGDNNTTLKIIESILKEVNCPIIIDADGINCLKNNKNILKDAII